MLPQSPGGQPGLLGQAIDVDALLPLHSPSQVAADRLEEGGGVLMPSGSAQIDLRWPPESVLVQEPVQGVAEIPATVEGGDLLDPLAFTNRCRHRRVIPSDVGEISQD